MQRFFQVGFLSVGLAMGLNGSIHRPGWAQTDATSSIFGDWLTEKKGVVMQFFPCEDDVCARIVWLKEPWDEAGAPKRDTRNSDPALRDRLWCGMTVLWALRPDDARDRWTDGWAYVPSDGRTVRVRAVLRNPDSLRVRGYIGIPAIGLTETWTRLDALPGSCP